LRPAVVKVNADEAADATGVAVKDTASADAAARVLIGQGASCVVVTLGLHGAIIATETIVHWLVPPEIRGTYPVGSGDAFLGGMAVGIARGDDMVFAAGLGLAAATANALTPGAGELDPDTADSIQAGVIVRTFRITT
jgi:fructose-1-phosphate kinase PfkB-like protein